MAALHTDAEKAIVQALSTFAASTFGDLVRVANRALGLPPMDDVCYRATDQWLQKQRRAGNLTLDKTSGKGHWRLTEAGREKLVLALTRDFVPHDQLAPGFWYLRTDVEPFYTVVSITRIMLGPSEGELGVWLIDEEGGHELGAFSPDQFLGPVPAPPQRRKP